MLTNDRLAVPSLSTVIVWEESPLMTNPSREVTISVTWTFVPSSSPSMVKGTSGIKLTFRIPLSFTVTSPDVVFNFAPA